MQRGLFFFSVQTKFTLTPWFSAFLIQTPIQISRANAMATLKEQFDEINFHPPLNSDFRERREYKGEKQGQSSNKRQSE